MLNLYLTRIALISAILLSLSCGTRQNATVHCEDNLREIFTALNETLRDERGKAAECLLRAEAILQTVKQQAVPATITARRGLAPWRGTSCRS